MTHQECTQDYHYVQRESQTQARGTVNVPQSTAASAAGIHVVGSLVQHIQREMEPVLFAARCANHPGGRGGLFCILCGE